jgi:hypothetical protein
MPFPAGAGGGYEKVKDKQWENAKEKEEKRKQKMEIARVSYAKLSVGEERLLMYFGESGGRGGRGVFSSRRGILLGLNKVDNVLRHAEKDPQGSWWIWNGSSDGKESGHWP